MPPLNSPRRWARRAVLSALAGSGLTAAAAGPLSAGALAAEPASTDTSSTPATTTPTTETTTTEEAAPPASTTSTPATTSTPTTTSSAPDSEIPAPAPPQAKAPAVVLQRKHKTSTAKKVGPSVTSTTDQPTGAATAPAAATPNNVAQAPEVVAAQAGALAAELAGSTASTQALSFYRIPLFLLPIYQAAAVQYGVPWQILAAINEIETNYGTDLSVSSAGAVGWMQFMPATWIQYGVDALDAGYADPYNPVDAIFAAARYLRAAGAATDLHAAILAYNHSDEYLNSVLLRAKLISSYPKDVIATLTGLTDGGMPVTGKDVSWGTLSAVPSSSSATASAVSAASSPQLSAPAAASPATAPTPAAAGVGATAKQAKKAKPLQLVDLMSSANASVVAAQDGRVMRLGSSAKLGRYVILRDVYGDVFTYAGLGSIAKSYPRPKAVAATVATGAASLPGAAGAAEPKPKLPASAGHQLPVTLTVKTSAQAPASISDPGTEPTAPSTGKVRLFAHPGNPDALASAARSSNKAGSHSATHSRLPLRVGSVVSKGTVLGRVRTPGGAHDGHLRFAIRPAGDTETIDPRPILENWAQLNAALHPQGASGQAQLLGATASGVFLLTKAELQRAVLSDPGISISSCARQDIASGAIDKRVLAVLAFLSRSGLKPTVSGMKCGLGETSASATASEADSGDAVDISAINGTPIAGHQGAGTITDVTIRALLTLQGEFVPHQIISLMQYPGAPNTRAMASRWNQVHVAFSPIPTPAVAAKAARSAKAGKTAALPVLVSTDLSGTQWNQLITHVAALPAPKVPAKPSSSAIKDTKASKKT